MILVGDSLGTTSLGYDFTNKVTIEDMINATEAVARVGIDKLLVSDLSYGTGLTISALQSFTDCPSKSFDNGMLGIDMGLANCTISLTSTTDATIKLNKFLVISPLAEIITNLSISQLNQAKDQHPNNGNHALLEIPINVNSEFGKVSTQINYTSYLHQIDRIENIDKTQWLPNTDLTLQTSHVRFDPITMSEIGYGFDKITLAASVEPVDSEFIIEVNDLYSSPQFTVISGGEKVSINNIKSNVSCIEGYCMIWIRVLGYRENNIIIY